MNSNNNKNKVRLLKFIYLLLVIIIILFLLNEYKNKDRVNPEIIYNDFNKNDIILEKEFEPKINQDPPSEKDNTSNKDTNLIFECPKPEKEYLDLSLLNVGQKIGIEDKTYIPSDLKEIEISFSTRKELCLKEETKNAFEDMAQDAKKDKIYIKISSAFRDYSYQSILFKNAIKNKDGDSISTAKPGHSEHQLGTTIDITGASINYLSASDSFNDTPEDLWLRENAHLYGFVQSYPYQKENITFYKYEPWHYRYIGKQKAQEVKDSGLTLKEYLEK